MKTARINEQVVSESRHANGAISQRVVRYELNGRTYETVRFYSESGVYFNFINRPAK